MKTQYLICGFLVGLAAQGHAQATGTWELEVPKAWLACKADAECAVVNFPCGPSVSVNGKYKDQTREIICKQHNCEVVSCDASAPQTDKASCVQGTCAPDYPAKK